MFPIHERLFTLAAMSEPDRAAELHTCAYGARDMLAVLKLLEAAASNRDSTMGDPIRLLDVKAELQAAAEAARTVIAAAEGRS